MTDFDNDENDGNTIARHTEEIPDIDAPWFPRKTQRLVGQAIAQADFLHACQGGRLPHAWIFYGTKGVGKASFAYQLARHFFSVADPTALTDLTTLPTDKASALVENEAHPDLFVLKRRWREKPSPSRFLNDIPAAEARAMRKFLQKTAARDGWRIAIIDSIDDMNREGVNSLLKLIEEPTPRVLFLILCHQIGNVPDTIKSRCRLLHFASLSPDDLRVIVRQHFPDMPDDALDLAVFLGEGSAARACRLAAHEGGALYTQFMQIVAQLPQPDIQAMHKFAAQCAARGKPENFAIFYDLLSGWLYRLIQTRAHGAPRTALPEQEAALSQKWAMRLPLLPATELWEAIQQQARQTERLNLDKKQTALEWFGQLSQIVPTN